MATHDINISFPNWKQYSGNNGMYREQGGPSISRKKCILLSISALTFILIFCIAIPLIITFDPLRIAMRTTATALNTTSTATTSTSTISVTTTFTFTTSSTTITSTTITFTTSSTTSTSTTISSTISNSFTRSTTSNNLISSTTSISNTSADTTSTSTISSATNHGPVVSLTNSGDIIIGLYNTTAGLSTGGFNGIYSSAAEQPHSAIDANTSTKYLNFGNKGCSGCNVYGPGIGTGFFITPSASNAIIAQGLLFATANDSPNRDPITVTLEGSTATNITMLHQGSSWTLIYNGSTGISPTIDPGRMTYVQQQNFSNTTPYASYRLLITSQRGTDSSVQYSESRIIGYV